MLLPIVRDESPWGVGLPLTHREGRLQQGGTELAVRTLKENKTTKAPVPVCSHIGSPCLCPSGTDQSLSVLRGSGVFKVSSYLNSKETAAFTASKNFPCLAVVPSQHSCQLTLTLSPY